jgi:hypothetical protein
MLTKRMQIQALADHLAGLNGDNGRLPLQSFAEPWQSAYRAVLEAPAGQAKQALCDALADRSDREAILGAILAATPGDWPTFASLREIEDTLPPIRWLWPDWIPRGMITLLGSVPGAGKSYLALDLARRVIAGEPFPNGAPQPLPKAAGAKPRVIYVDAESVPQILSERAQLWQMDRSRLYLMRPMNKLFIDFGNEADRDHLIEMAVQLEPALIVVDSLASISSKGENNVEDVRDLLGFLNHLALESQCGLLLVHHLRKRGMLPMMDMLTADDFRGSSHIIAMSRSVMALSIVQTGPKPDRNGPRRLEIVKTNLARYPEPLGMELKPLHPKGVWIEYTTEPPQPYREPTQAEQCAQWLLEALEEGPGKPKDLEKMAKEQGFSRATLYRARASLGDHVGNTASRQNPRNEWCLVEQQDDPA